MANPENLKNRDLTSEEAREMGRRGGIASGESRRARKTFKEAIKILLETQVKDADGELKTIQDIGLDALAKKLMDGDLNTFLAFRDTIGEKPTEKIDTNVNLSYEEALKQVAGKDEY